MLPSKRLFLFDALHQSLQSVHVRHLILAWLVPRAERHVMCDTKAAVEDGNAAQVEHALANDTHVFAGLWWCCFQTALKELLCGCLPLMHSKTLKAKVKLLVKNAQDASQTVHTDDGIRLLAQVALFLSLVVQPHILDDITLFVDASEANVEVHASTVELCLETQHPPQMRNLQFPYGQWQLKDVDVAVDVVNVSYLVERETWVKQLVKHGVCKLGTAQ